MTKMQKQRGEYDCALCSVAMALSSSPEALFKPERFALAEQKRATAPGDLLTELGMVDDKDFWSVYLGSTRPMGNVLDLLKGRPAILQVPSLNNPPPANHIIFWDGEELFDPSNRQVYRWLAQCTGVGYVTLFSREIARAAGH